MTILEAVRIQLEGFRIFIANPGREQSIPEQLETSIMNNLYLQPRPICDTPNQGMQLVLRWDSEDPIIAKSNGAVVLHGHIVTGHKHIGLHYADSVLLLSITSLYIDVGSHYNAYERKRARA